MCPRTHSDAGLGELLPLIVGGLDYSAASLSVRLVMCQALELLMSCA